MSEKTLRYQKTNHVLVIDLNGPFDHSLLKSQIWAELGELCDEATWDEEVRVVVISDTGEKALSGETDLTKAVSVDGLEEEMEPQSVTEPISKLDRPGVAVISGGAIGGGV